MASTKGADGYSPATVHRWCFTFHLLTQADLDHYELLQAEGVRRFVYQFETTEEGFAHVQGYVELIPNLNWRFARAKRYCGMGTDRAHIEPCRGSALDNYKYCTKLDSRLCEGEVFGDWEKVLEKGRNSWTGVIEAVQKGTSWQDMYATFPRESLIAFRGISRAFKFVGPPVLPLTPDEVDFVWIHGPPGVGKTRMVWDHATHAGERIYVKAPDNKWWGGYDPSYHTVVLIDDYQVNDQLGHRYLLNLLDLYPLQTEEKGDQTLIRPKKIVITSNFHPCELFSQESRFTDEDLLTHSSNNPRLSPLIRRLVSYGAIFAWTPSGSYQEASIAYAKVVRHTTFQAFTDFVASLRLRDVPPAVPHVDEVDDSLPSLGNVSLFGSSPSPEMVLDTPLQQQTLEASEDSTGFLAWATPTPPPTFDHLIAAVEDEEEEYAPSRNMFIDDEARSVDEDEEQDIVEEEQLFEKTQLVDLTLSSEEEL